MAGEAYEILALLMRYVFVLIGALVLLRAYRWMRRDARNYRREMRTLPDAGLVGEIVDLRTGKSQPLFTVWTMFVLPAPGYGSSSDATMGKAASEFWASVRVYS